MLEQAVQVQVGKRTLVAVNLTRAGEVKTRAHAHGEWWGDGDSITLLDGTILPKSGYVDTGALSSDQFYCVTDYQCTTDLRPRADAVVPPGAGRIEVVLDWNPAGNAPQDAALQVQTTHNTTTSDFVRRGPRDPFVIPFFPIEADPGHMKFTQWTFKVSFRPANDMYNVPSSPPALIGGPLKVKITAHKTVVPLEPPHGDLWQGRSEILLVKDTTGKTGCACDNPRDDSGDPASWTPVKGAFVPPGTREIKAKLTWTSYLNPANDAVKWKLAYRGSNVPPARWAEGLREATPETRGDHYATFKIVPKPEEVDEFYQTRSYWEFYLDDGEAPWAATYGPGALGYQQKIFLEAGALKDPAYSF